MKAIAFVWAVLTAMIVHPRPLFAGPGGFFPTGTVVATNVFGEVYSVSTDGATVGLVSSSGQFVSPENVAFSSDGRTVFVADPSAIGGTIFAVDPATHTQTAIVSGGPVNQVRALSVGPDGFIYCSRAADGAGPSGVVRVDPTTGSTKNVSSGGFFQQILDMEFSAQGALFVLESLYTAGGGVGAIVRVDTSTGSQTLVCAGPKFQSVRGFGTAANGKIYVVDGFVPSVIAVDVASGTQTTISSDSLLCSPGDIAVQRDGTLLVTASCGPCPPGGCEGNAIVKVDPSSGAQSIFSTLPPDGIHLGGLIIFRGGSVTAATPTTWGRLKAVYH